MKIKGLMITFVDSSPVIGVNTEEGELILQNDLPCHQSFITAATSAVSLLKMGLEEPDKFIFEKRPYKLEMTVTKEIGSSSKIFSNQHTGLEPVRSK